MTINHLFLHVKAHRMAAMQEFYKDVLKPLGYNEMIRASNNKTVGYGTDYPYFWLRAVPEGHTPYPTHIAFDAPSNDAVDEFHRLGLLNGGTDNGKPYNRDEMSRQPYYAAFIIDPEGNNIEATCMVK